jgi:hypothetical protein
VVSDRKALKEILQKEHDHGKTLSLQEHNFLLAPDDHTDGEHLHQNGTGGMGGKTEMESGASK